MTTDTTNRLEYEIRLLKENVEFLKNALNEARAKLGLPAINVAKSAHG